MIEAEPFQSTKVLGNADLAGLGAKNGFIDFDPARATSADPLLHDAAFDVQSEDWNVTFGSVAYQTAPLVTTSRQVSLATQKISRD